MAESEYRGKYEAVKKDPLKPWYPVIGLLLLGIAGAAAFFARVPAYAFLKRTLLQDVGANLPDDTTMEFVVAFGIGLAIIGIFSMVFALFAPKSKNRKLVSESTLKNQKDEMNAERQRAKRRKLQMQAKMKKTRREQNSE